MGEWTPIATRYGRAEASAASYRACRRPGQPALEVLVAGRGLGGLPGQESEGAFRLPQAFRALHVTTRVSAADRPSLTSAAAGEADRAPEKRFAPTLEPEHLPPQNREALDDTARPSLPAPHTGWR